MEKLYAEELGKELKDVTVEMLGKAESVKISKENTTIVNGKGEKKQYMIEFLKLRDKLKKLLQISIEKNYKKDLLNLQEE